MKNRKVSVQVRLSANECMILLNAIEKLFAGNIGPIFADLYTRLTLAGIRAQRAEEMRTPSERKKK